MNTRSITAAIAFLASIVAANYLTTRFGFVPVGFGYAATAGTYLAGLTLGLRDVVQDVGGRRLTVALILAGAALSWLVGDPRIAAASGVAFLISELADYAIYTPLRREATYGTRRWSAAVAASNAGGAVLDTAIFLGIAFGVAAITADAMIGQLVGKGWATAVVIAAAALLRHRKR